MPKKPTPTLKWSAGAHYGPKFDQIQISFDSLSIRTAISKYQQLKSCQYDHTKYIDSHTKHARDTHHTIWDLMTNLWYKPILGPYDGHFQICHVHITPKHAQPIPVKSMVLAPMATTPKFIKVKISQNDQTNVCRVILEIKVLQCIRHGIWWSFQIGKYEILSTKLKIRNFLGQFWPPWRPYLNSLSCANSQHWWVIAIALKKREPRRDESSQCQWI